MLLCSNKSSAERNKVVSDIFSKFEFSMKNQNMGLYAHFATFLKVIILLVSKILRKNGVKSVVSGKKKHVPVVQCNKVVSTTYYTLALTFEYFFSQEGLTL